MLPDGGVDLYFTPGHANSLAGGRIPPGEVNPRLGFGLLTAVARAVAERLHFARLQLAAARV